MFLFYFYVPEDHAESVKNALFNCGAGKIGNYQECCWQTLGQGQFRPTEGSEPFLGETNQITRVPELKVEMVIDDAHVNEIKQTLLQTHPYEKVAYGFISLSAI